jgi:hypothetical protein
MLDNVLGTRISGQSSSRRVGLSRMMLGWVGVQIGVKDRSQIGCLPVDGDIASAHDGTHGIARCVRSVGASHELCPGLGVAGEQDAEPLLRCSAKIGDLSRSQPPLKFVLAHHM